MTHFVKGNQTLTVGDTTYNLALDYNAITRIEDAFDKSIWDVLRQSLVEGNYWFSDLALILCELMRAGGHEDINPEEAGNLLFSAGLKDAAIAVAEVFKSAFADVLDGGFIGREEFVLFID